MSSVLFRKYIYLGVLMFFASAITLAAEKNATGVTIKKVFQAFTAHDKDQLEEALALLSPEELNLTSLGGLTLMHHVVIDGLDWAIPSLLKAGVNMEVGDKKGNSPLHYALYLRKPEFLRLFLKNGASARLANNYNFTLLHEASIQGDNDAVKLLLSYKANPNSIDDKGRTPLFYAAYRGDADTVNLLIDAGANSSLRDKDGEDVAHRAAAGGSLSIVNTLINRGVSFDRPDNNNDLPIHKALRYDRSAVVKKLFDTGYFSEKSDIFGKNALHWLSFYDSNDELFDLILAQYPQLIDGVNVVMQTPLHLAAAFAKESTVNKLLKAGADPLARDRDGFLPQDYAIGYGKTVNQELIEEAAAIKK
jgi:ankyrin repeat protein